MSKNFAKFRGSRDNPVLTGALFFGKNFFRLFLTANPTETIIIYCYTELHNEQKCDPFFALYLKFSRKKQKTQLKISIGTS